MPRPKFWCSKKLRHKDDKQPPNNNSNIKINSSIHNNSTKLNINLINVQYLTQPKYIEIENILENDIDNINIFCLVETQQTRNSIKTRDSTKYLSQMREKSDKKGGGLLVIWKNEELALDHIVSDHPDILVAHVNIRKLDFILILVYISTNNELRNIKIYKELKKIASKYDNKKLIFLGDFNGHIEILGKQKLNKNGKTLLKFVEDNNLNILNLDQNCQGLITWKQNENNSVIDFALTNENMYKNFNKMIIDDEWKKLDISDHCLITIQIDILNNKKNTDKKVEITFNRKSEKAINKFKEYVNTKIEESDNLQDIDQINEIICEAEEKVLKVRLKKQIKPNEKIEPMWITREIKKEIAQKRIINKKRRKAKNPITNTRLKREFYKQKEKIHLLVKNEIENYEKHITSKILNDKNRGKQIWKHIKRLQNRDKINNKKEISIYDKNNIKVEKQKVEDIIEECWNPIYNQHENKILSEWNEAAKLNYKNNYTNESNMQGRYKSSISIEGGIVSVNYENIEIPNNVRDHDYCMIVKPEYKRMKNPVISKEDINTQLMKIKAGKAPGPDTIRPELFKYLADEKYIINNLMIIYNNIIETGIIPENWKKSNTVLIPKIKNLKQMN